VSVYKRPPRVASGGIGYISMYGDDCDLRVTCRNCIHMAGDLAVSAINSLCYSRELCSFLHICCDLNSSSLSSEGH
jgi:hypothetical protein